MGNFNTELLQIQNMNLKRYTENLLKELEQNLVSTRHCLENQEKLAELTSITYDVVFALCICGEPWNQSPRLYNSLRRYVREMILPRTNAEDTIKHFGYCAKKIPLYFQCFFGHLNRFYIPSLSDDGHDALGV